MRPSEKRKMRVRYSPIPQKVLFEIMAKIEKKKAKLLERIQLLENEMIESLTKKTSTTREINVPSMTRQIDELKKQLRELK